MRRAHRSASLLAACLALASGAAAQGPLDGSFASGRLAMELHQNGDQLSGTLTVDGAPCPLAGTIHDERLTAEFDRNGQKFPLEAGLEGPVLVVTSGGVTHRLVRQVVEGNPLADPALSQAPGADPRFPQVLTLPSGATIRYPEGWTTQALGRFAALVPTPAPGQILPQAAYGVLTVPWPRSLGLSTPEGGERLATVIGQLLPGLTRETDPVPLDASGDEGVRVQLAGPSLTGQACKVHVLARNQADALALILGMGDESSLRFDAPTLKDMLATVQAPPSGVAPSDDPPPQATNAVSIPQTLPAAPPASAPLPAEQPAAPSASGSAPAAPPALAPDQQTPPSTAAPAPTPAAPPDPAVPPAPPPKAPAPPKAAPVPPPSAPAPVGPALPIRAPVLPQRPDLAPLRPPQVAVPAKPALDPAVVGTWRTSETHVSGTATLVIETIYRFNADGTFTLGSRSAGGDARTSLESGLKVSAAGTWSASRGVLKTTNQKGQAFQVNYLFYKGQLVFKRGPGKYTFWSR